LVKDHKKINSVTGRYPTRLVIPASNFTAGFVKLGKDGIVEFFKSFGIDFCKRNIIQASDLKNTLENLELKEGLHTLSSVDVESMYPSIKYSLIEDAIWHYVVKAFKEMGKKLEPIDRNTIEVCLEFVRFSMGNTLIDYGGKYYEYDGDKTIEERGLTIGGFESAWLADLAIAYILEDMGESKPALFDRLGYLGFYRDDGFTYFNGRLTVREMENWLHDFQMGVNEVVGDDSIKFTADIFQPIKDGYVQDKKSPVSVNFDSFFPFLDMKMTWSKSRNLQFGIFYETQPTTKVPQQK
jgi:hypothetical protein